MSKKHKQQIAEATLKNACATRLSDADVLFKHAAFGNYNGAVLMAYYALECYIKARIAKHSLHGTLRKNFYFHLDEYEFLIEGAGLGNALRSAPDIWDKLRSLASIQHDESRYNQVGYTKQEAEQVLKTVREVIKWIKSH